MSSTSHVYNLGVIFDHSFIHEKEVYTKIKHCYYYIKLVKLGNILHMRLLK